MAASDAVDTLRQEIKTLETEINSLNDRIKDLINEQENHPERWNLLQEEILENKRLALENKRQITEKQTTVELITRQQLTLKRGPQGQLAEERHSKSSRSSSPYSTIDALHGKPALDLLTNSEQGDLYFFFHHHPTVALQDFVRTIVSSTLGSIDGSVHPTEDQIQKQWDAFAAALFSACDASQPHTLSYFNTSNKPIFSTAKYRPDIAICEAQVKDINRVMATNIISIGELKRDPSCFNDPTVVHQLAKYASLYFKETPSRCLKCFVATNLAIRGYEFRRTGDDIIMSSVTYIYDLQSSEGIHLLACLFLPPAEVLPLDFGFRGLHVEGWDVIHYLGRGVSSQVFAARSLQDHNLQVAIKVSQREFPGVLAEDIRFMEQVTHPSLPTLIGKFSYYPKRSSIREFKMILSFPWMPSPSVLSGKDIKAHLSLSFILNMSTTWLMPSKSSTTRVLSIVTSAQIISSSLNSPTQSFSEQSSSISGSVVS